VRIKVILDDELVAEAFRLSEATLSIKELIETTLTEYVNNRGNQLSTLLQEGLDDIKNGNILTEEEMDKELVETVLTKYVNNRKEKSLKELKGKINFADGYDHKKMREQI
jgi:predicted transcriptional regulator